MGRSKNRGQIQFAALPFRHTEEGQLQVMLLTSRETKRWIIPKGWPMRSRKPHEVAAQEAFEEAGLVGQIVSPVPVGSYHYAKRRTLHESILCKVEVFLFRVASQLADWPEKAQRVTRWFEPADASTLVDESALAEILREMSR